MGEATLGMTRDARSTGTKDGKPGSHRAREAPGARGSQFKRRSGSGTGGSPPGIKATALGTKKLHRKLGEG